MLSQQDKTLMGILIAIVNGVEIEEIDAPLEAWIRNCLFILKQHTTNEETINLTLKWKEKYLSSCMQCQAPCGRTNNYQFDAVKNKKVKEAKLKEFSKLLEEYFPAMELSSLVYRIAKLGW